MLGWARAETERVDSSGLELDEIVDLMVGAHGQGRRVVRLHTGDPSLYGAIHEQFAALEKRGVGYQGHSRGHGGFCRGRGPGVVEYTLPEVCQTLILTRAPGRTPVPDAERLSELARHGASLAIYLSASLAEEVAAALIPAYGPEAPLAVVYRVSWPDQRILWTTTTDLARDIREAGLTRQLLILGGAFPWQFSETGPIPRCLVCYNADFSHGWRPAK